DADEEEASGEGGGDVGDGDRAVTIADHFEQLELQSREGGQRAADAGGEERMGKAVLGVVAEPGEEVAEQQGADHVDPEGSPGPAIGPMRRRLREADASQRAEHSPEVDSREAAKVELSGAHGGLLSASIDVAGTVSGSKTALLKERAPSLRSA